MNAVEKGRIVAEHYPSRRWAQRVSLMSDKQVHVIYMRLLNSGELKGKA